MKKTILLCAVILLSTAGFTQAQEGKLGGTLDFTWQSSYIWRGFDIYGEKNSAIQPSLDLDLYGTGLGAKVFWSRARGSGSENLEELDLFLYYKNTIYEDQPLAIDYKVGWGIYTYPDEPRSARDMQEAFASISLPQLCPAGIVPSYTAIVMWPSEGDSALNENGGMIHVFGLGYNLTCPDTPEHVLHLSADFVYNDGVGGAYAANGTVDHDWSHMVYGLSTDFALSGNVIFTPGFYYQLSMDDSVNPENEAWVSLSLKYKF